ncbi:S4 domain-containing protein [Rhizobium sp. OAE497]
MSSSKSEARRAIASRGVRLDGNVVEDLDLVVLVQPSPVRLSFGENATPS